MRTALHRTSGYLLPTTLMVAGLHLARQWTAGEALAGVVSALFFTACFLAGAVLEARSHRGGPRESGWPAIREGLLLGTATWLVVWAFWNVPMTAGLSANAALGLGLNALANGLAGLARIQEPDPRRLAIH